MVYSVKKYKLLLFFTIFFGPNVIDFLGIEGNNYNAMLMAVSAIFVYCNKKCLSREIVYLIIFTVFYGAFKIYTDTGEGTRAVVLCAMSPAVLFAAYPRVNLNNSKSLRLWKSLFIMLLVFFFVEVGIAIYERATWNLVFGWQAENELSSDLAVTEFRSTALLGHPLANALVVSVLMSFFLISPIKVKYKYLLWFLGFIAILCFNARGATLGNLAVFGLYFFYAQILNGRSKHKVSMILLVAALVGVAAYLVLNGYIGGRLITDDLNDESAQVRIDIWSVFTKYDIKTFLIGVNFNELGMIMYSLGLYATENYWLDWVFRLGFLFLVPYVILNAKVIKSEYDGYSKIDMLVTLITFLGISSTNNSLSTSALPMFVFLFCIRMFNRKTIGYLLPKKMLDINN